MTVRIRPVSSANGQIERRSAGTPLRVILRSLGSLVMNAHSSLSNRADARSFVIVQGVRGLGPAMRPPLAARPEGRSADLPQECSGIIVRSFAVGDSNTLTGNRVSVKWLRPSPPRFRCGLLCCQMPCRDGPRHAPRGCSGRALVRVQEIELLDPGFRSDFRTYTKTRLEGRVSGR